MSKFKKWFLRLPLMNEELYSIFMYLVMGGLTTVINIVSYWLAIHYGGIDYRLANIIAWFLAVIFAYVTNRLYVFESQQSEKEAIFKEALSFFGFRLLSLGMELVSLVVMVDFLQVGELWAKVIASVIVLIANYIFSRLIIFKK